MGPGSPIFFVLWGPDRLICWFCGARIANFFRFVWPGSPNFFRFVGPGSPNFSFCGARIANFSFCGKWGTSKLGFEKYPLHRGATKDAKVNTEVNE